MNTESRFVALHMISVTKVIARLQHTPTLKQKQIGHSTLTKHNTFVLYDAVKTQKRATLNNEA